MIKKSNLSGIWLSLVNCIIALPALKMAGDYYAVRVLAVISFVLFGVLLLRRLNNIFFLVRTLFLGGIGYYPMLVKVLAGADVRFSLYEASTQGFDIVIVMYVATSLALLGNEIGLALGSRISDRPSIRHFATPSELWRTIFYICIPTILVVSFVTIQAAGPTVFTAIYASDAGGQLLGNTQNIGIICLLAMFVAMNKLTIKYDRLTFYSLAIFFLVWAMFFRGLRQDVVTAILGLVVCYGLVQGKEYSVGRRTLLIALLFIVVVEFMGVARAMLAIEGIGFYDMWEIFSEVISGNAGVYHYGTVSPIDTTFANAVYLIDTNKMGFLYGKSFLEFIPRTPPEFLYPDRPADYAWIFPQYGLDAGGGLFELAEAYMNFGMLGALFIPGILSFLMAKAFYNALSKQTVLSYFLLFSFLGMFLRGTWYQIFAFYKSFLTALILYVGFVVLHALMKNSTRPVSTTVIEVRNVAP